MKHALFSDMKKIYYVKKYRQFLLFLILCTIFFSLLFMFTLDVTQGKNIADLANVEILDISLLGMDVTAILLVIFTANFIARDFTTNAIYESLAIIPMRRTYFLSKIVFITCLSFLVSTLLIGCILIINYGILSLYEINHLSILSPTIFMKLFAGMIMPIFYSNLSALGVMYARSTSSGIVFALSMMFLPALVKLSPPYFARSILAFLPEKAFELIANTSTLITTREMVQALFILFIWIALPYFIANRKFKKIDF